MIWIGSTHPATIAREFYQRSGEPWRTAGDQIAAEIDQRGKPMEWQPIETAPTNTSVLIYIPNAEHYGEGIYRGILVDMRPTAYEPYWTTSALNCGSDCARKAPTHWMPLPDPPEVRQ